MRPSRREFVEAGHGERHLARPVAAGGGAGARLCHARDACQDDGCGTRRARGIGRIDGVAKVTGAKLYASDFRAADLPGWPPNTSHAMLVRVADATHVFDGIDLAFLSDAAKPSVVVTAEDLERLGARVPEFYAGDLFCPIGQDTALSRPARGAADL